MAGRKSKGRTNPDAPLAAVAESAAETREAKYIGNKVKVPVNRNTPPKKRPHPHSPSEVAPRLNLLNAHSDDVKADDDASVDMSVSPMSDPKLEEFRMAGLQEGRQLAVNSTPLAIPGSAELAEPGPPDEKEQAIAVPVEQPSQELYYAPVPAPTDIVEFGAPDNDDSGDNDDDNVEEHHPGRKKKKAMQKEALRAAEREAAAADAIPQPVPEPVAETEMFAEPVPEPETLGESVTEPKTFEETVPPVKEEHKRISLPRKLVMLASALLMLFSFSPLLVGVLTPGIIPPFCIGLFFLLIAYNWPKITACKKPWFNKLFTACTIVIIAGITLISFIFGKMYAASAVEPPDIRSDYTVIVLGCKIIGEEPSLMLHDRLEAASEFLLEHPGSYCIVSGGQGDDEPCPEATVMKRYLVDKGISELRIVEERNSFSTKENIENSCSLLDSCNLYEDIVIVSDRFHQYRARRYVEQHDLRCYAVNSETRWYLAMQYWFREMVAVLLQMLGLKN